MKKMQSVIYRIIVESRFLSPFFLIVRKKKKQRKDNRVWKYRFAEQNSSRSINGICAHNCHNLRRKTAFPFRSSRYYRKKLDVKHVSLSSFFPFICFSFLFYIIFHFSFCSLSSLVCIFISSFLFFFSLLLPYPPPSHLFPPFLFFFSSSSFFFSANTSAWRPNEPNLCHFTQSRSAFRLRSVVHRGKARVRRSVWLLLPDLVSDLRSELLCQLSSVWEQEKEHRQKIICFFLPLDFVCTFAIHFLRCFLSFHYEFQFL